MMLEKCLKTPLPPSIFLTNDRLCFAKLFLLNFLRQILDDPVGANMKPPMRYS